MPSNLKRGLKGVPRIPEWPVGLHLVCKCCRSEWDISQTDFDGGRVWSRGKKRGDWTAKMACPVCGEWVKKTTRRNMEL